MAMFALAKIADKEQNYTHAAKSYERAAIAGHNLGQYILGQRYRDGHGVKRDYEKARYWFELSAKHPPYGKDVNAALTQLAKLKGKR